MRALLCFLLLVVAAGVSGCAELRNRGGAVDWLEDRFLFVADTKPMRVLRGYVLVAGLARVASKSAASQEERKEIAMMIQSTLQSVDAARVCAGSKRNDQGNLVQSSSGCPYFDDLMTSVDYSTLRLARAVFLPEENKDLLVLVRRGLSDQSGPLAGIDEVLDTAGRIVDAGGGILKIGGQTLDATGAILRLASQSFKLGGRLTPIYRDTIELEMNIALDYLRESGLACKNQHGPFTVDARLRSDDVAGWDACSWRDYLEALYNDGSGDFRHWRHNVALFFKDPNFRSKIVPKERHFHEVFELVERGCQSLIGTKTGCLPATTKGPV